MGAWTVDWRGRPATWQALDKDWTQFLRGCLSSTPPVQLPELAPLTNLRSLTLRSVVAAAAARSLPLLPSLERLQLEECVLPLPATLPALTWLCELSVLAAELPHPPQHHLLEAAMCEELLAACSRLQHLSSLVLQLPWAVRLDCMPILPQLQHFWWGGRAATGQLPPGWGSTLCMLAAPMHVVLALQQQLEASGMLHTLCTWEVQTEARLAALRQLAHLPSLRCMHLLHPKPPLPVDVPEVVSAHMHAGRVNMDDCLQRLFEVDNLHLPDISDDEI